MKNNEHHNNSLLHNKAFGRNVRRWGAIIFIVIFLLYALGYLDEKIIISLFFSFGAVSLVVLYLLRGELKKAIDHSYKVLNIRKDDDK
jgi:hypothetical protein